MVGRIKVLGAPPAMLQGPQVDPSTAQFPITRTYQDIERPTVYQKNSSNFKGNRYNGPTFPFAYCSWAKTKLFGATTAARCAGNVLGFSSAQLVSTSTREETVLQLSTLRILVVDDFGLFRQLVVELLGKRPELQVVGEASDGLEALQMAAELRPDLDNFLESGVLR